MFGSACGRRKRQNIWAGDAPIDRARCSISRGAPRSPTTELITIGKNATSTTMTIFGAMPKPNQASSSGASATFGMVCEPTISG